MKTYAELTLAQQDKAVEHELNSILVDICEGVDYSDSPLSERIAEAERKAEAAQTPWFLHEYVMETCAEDLKDLARFSAENSLYSEPHEFVIQGVL